MARLLRRKVTGYLKINFKGQEFDVSDIPNVHAGDTLFVSNNQTDTKNSVQVMHQDEEGREYWHVVRQAVRDKYGFWIDAPVIGG